MTVEADALDVLFRRAATGMMQLVRADPVDAFAGEGSPGTRRESAGVESRRIELDISREDVGMLLVRWLRELLYLQEVEGFVYGEADFDRLDASGLHATVTARPQPTREIRELKGVTYHGLEVERDDDGWRARVIFDI